MIDKEDFFKKNKLNDKLLAERKLDWDNLLKIAYDFDKYQAKYKDAFNTLVNSMWDIPKIHFVRGRIKDPEHLLEKIYRKASDKRIITIDNYKDEFDDLFGIRIIHLFKEDWIQIHNILVDEFGACFDYFDVNLRDGDNSDIFRKNNKNKNINFNLKEAYRSVHYILKHKMYGKEIKFELQVRTIYEEAFGEIDHSIRYPDNQTDETLSKYFSMLNVISGIGDEMGSFAHKIKEQKERFTDLSKSTAYLTSALRDKDREIERLSLKIKELEKNKEAEKLEDNKDLESLDVAEPIAIESNPLSYSLTQSLKQSGVDSKLAKTASYHAISNVNKIIANNNLINNSFKNLAISPNLVEAITKFQDISTKFPNYNISKLMTAGDLITNSKISPKITEAMLKFQDLSIKLSNNGLHNMALNNNLINPTFKGLTVSEDILKLSNAMSKLPNISKINQIISSQNLMDTPIQNLKSIRNSKNNIIKFKKSSPTNLNRISKYYLKPFLNN